MLKALELSGFKSFADRTRFDFPRGISVVVGPNGSGKSNVVDAVKWVLGSQSAKSLRGREMTDVIFNGAASRGPAGTAEVTLTLDNSNRVLAIDADDVHVARRVYRSGEAEYLINRQPCRLRDVRELLAKTGITTEAYCIIEQGKVDALLQSSPRDRRVIFEEAAGISQFKIKKVAAERRMERVEQNLLRLSDIVSELEGRVRSVRSQAGKARRYRECASRLQELRTQVGLVDWRALTERIAARERQLAELFHEQGKFEALVAEHDARDQRFEQEIDLAGEQMRKTEAVLSGVREQIAAQQAALEARQTRHAELQQEVARARRQLLALTSRAGSTTQQLRELSAELAAAERELATLRAVLQEHEAQFQDALVAHSQTNERLNQAQAEHDEAERRVTTCASQLAAARAQQAAVLQAFESQQSQLTQAEAELAKFDADAESQTTAEAELAQTVARGQSVLTRAEQACIQMRGELARGEKQFRQLEQQLTRTRERISVLAELEQRLEGLDSGVRQVLRRAGEDPASAFGGVLGVVADLFHVDVDTAPLIEVALGERAQFLVVKTWSLLVERLLRGSLGVSNRVGFLRLEGAGATSALDGIDLSSEPGVMGRADRFVETDPEFVNLRQRLLARTWLVDRLETALRLMQSAGRGLEFVTSDGELLTADGTLVVGPRSAVVGILSRRSELRACHEQVSQLERQIAEQQFGMTRLNDTLARQEAAAATAKSALAQRTTELVEQRHRASAARGRRDQARLARTQLAEALQQLEAERAALAGKCEVVAREKAAAEARFDRAAAAWREWQAAAAELGTRLASLRESATGKQVAAARCEERVELLRAQAAQIARDQEEKDRVLAEARDRLAAREVQVAEQDAQTLAGRQSLAELFLRKEELGAEFAVRESAIDALRVERSQMQLRTRESRERLSGLQSQRHKLEVAAERLRHERKSLCDRMQEDYDINLASVATGEVALSADSDSNREAVEREIAELRNQLSTIGSVNLDALEELDAVELRYNHLAAQQQDLIEAKQSLERIIQRINVDSQQLFTATIDSVRGHFQELFRRLFGGGEADIVLEEGEDVLECGIEVIARPPGKEACSISLLSGGEKTLTCVALLLAVFRSKPSPFCVLDEVDAALDEANIGRFVGVLRDFLSFTQFIVVSHSKKTMSGGDTLYGVTMEESGVSKRVAVRFEDVSEDGQIRPSAVVQHRRAA